MPAFNFRNVLLQLIVIVIVIWIDASGVQANERIITLAVNVGYGEQRNHINRTISEFRENHPQIDVRARFTGDVAQYIKLVDKWLNDDKGPDLIFWYGGKRISRFAKDNKLKDLSDFWQEHKLNNYFPQAVSESAKFNGATYAVPITYYYYGLYYRESTFTDEDVKVPKTWEELLSACRAFRKKNIDLFALGTKTAWSTHGWFDFLSLRLHGLKFHRQLLDGEIAYTDARVLTTLNHWKELLENSCFNLNHTTYTNWQAFPRVLHKMSAMMLSDGALPSGVPQNILDDIQLTNFPSIKKNIPEYTVSPINVFIVPQYAIMDDNIKELLQLLSGVKFQSAFNSAIRRPPARSDAYQNASRLTKDMLVMLQRSPGGIEYFDRETDIRLARKTPDIFLSFLKHGNVQRCANELEQIRITVFGSLKRH